MHQQLRHESQLGHIESDSVAIRSLESQLKDRLHGLIGEDSIASFARRCGLNEALVRKYLAGAIPSSDRLVLMADAANVSIEWLATGRGDKDRSSLNSQSSSSFDDQERLTCAIESVENGLVTPLTPRQKAELIAAAYALLTTNTPAVRAQVAHLIKLASQPR